MKLAPAERQARLIEGAKKEGELDLVPNYRGRQMRDHVGMFEKRHPWMKVRISDLNSYQALERVLAEETAGKSLTDASKMNLPDYVAIDGKNLIARYPTPATQKILPKYRGFLSPDNLWVPQSVSEEAISYNTGLVRKEDAPKSWQDLCHPRFKGMVAYDVGEPLFLSGLYQILGRDMEKVRQIVECIGKNEPIVIAGNTSRITLMLAGDHAIQGGNSLYQGIKSNQDNPRRAIFAVAYDAPVIVFSSVMWINKNVRRPHAAALYVDWIVSEESQEFLYKEKRGPITMEHPFISPEASLVVLSPLKLEQTTQLQTYWKQYIGKK